MFGHAEMDASPQEKSLHLQDQEWEANPSPNTNTATQKNVTKLGLTKQKTHPHSATHRTKLSTKQTGRLLDDSGSVSFKKVDSTNNDDRARRQFSDYIPR